MIRTPVIWLILLGMTCIHGMRAQERFAMSGYGNFEAFNVGMRHHIRGNIFMYGYGNDLNIFGQGYYNCIFGSFGRPIFKKRLKAPHMVSLHFRALVWNIENKSNIFSAVACAPLLRYDRKLGEKFLASVYAGYVYSSVFRYKRKGFYEIGWPREWLPDFGVSLQYCVSCK